MDKKVPILLLMVLSMAPALTVAQKTRYFPDRLLIRYESGAGLSHLKPGLQGDPKSAVEQFLMQRGAREMRPLFQGATAGKLRQKQLPQAQGLLQIQEVVFGRSIDPVQLAAKISRMPGVVYAEPRYIRYTGATVNDPIQGDFIQYHNFTDAWDITTGSGDVVIAVVDAGVGYTHNDLDDKLWVNQQEVPAGLSSQADLNGDGAVTSTEIAQYLQQNGEDYNGDGSILLDDALHADSPFMDLGDGDNNGFSDDLFGWDFWDSGAPGQEITPDNNPIHDGSDHGTHVTGIAAAETNNDSGMAAAGYNSSYMAVKAGGTPDDPSTPDQDESSSIAFGFQGILYATEQGADIINCSWGGGGFSQVEQDVINYAAANGSLVVAAAGNESEDGINYPAGYDKVLSVGSVNTGGALASYSNYGYSLDVLTTGNDIQSTSYGSQFAAKSGTSMATPVASGLAALLREIHPDWAAERIALQIRASASPVDQANAGRYQSKLGHGRLNAFEALDSNKPGLKVVSADFRNENGEKLGLNQEGFLNLTLTNRGDATASLSLEAASLNEGGITWSSNSQSLGSVSTGDTVQAALQLTITDAFNLNAVPTFRINWQDPSQNYADFNVVRYDNFLYDIMAANNVKTSFAADGTIGFTDPLNGSGGVGFIPRRPDGSGGFEEGENLLFEGGLMIEVDGQMFDAVRTTDGRVSRDFRPVELFSASEAGPGAVQGQGAFSFGQDSARRAMVDLRTYAFEEPPRSNVVYVEYTLQNPNSFYILENVYLGLFNDWDIGSNSSNNSIQYSEADSILYVANAASNASDPLVAVAHLGPVSGALAIDNAVERNPDSLTFGLYDGFTDAEKRAALTSGVLKTSVQNTDASAVVASGPYTIDPGAAVTVGFVYAFGEDLGELRNQIAAARSQMPFSVSPAGRAVSSEVPPTTTLFQNYPNPFQARTRFRIDLESTGAVKLTIYDVLGRKVQTLIDRELEARSHFIEFDAADLSSGVYFARLKTRQGVQTIPLTLVK